jgi:diguanylate cyclase (GGDEF)-like protein
MQRGAQDAHWELPLDGGPARYSERVGELLEVSDAQVAHTRDFWLERVHPAEREALERGLEALAAGSIGHLELEHRLKTDAGNWLWVHVRAVRVSTPHGDVLTGWLSDISARKSAEGQLRYHAFRDSVTGLANRSLFMDRLAQRLTTLREGGGAQAAVLLIDLDRFKRVNDSLNHSVGDLLLNAVAERLIACVQPKDTLARLGGDEFALLLDQVTSCQEAIDAAKRVHAALREPVGIEGRFVTVGASVGIVLVDAQYDAPSDVLRDADTAMYRAKAMGRGQWALFDVSMRERAKERMALENELRSALVNDEIEVHFQPLVDSQGRFAGAEALPRWRHPRFGQLLAGDFIELAEETGLIMDLGDLVLKHACTMGRRISEQLGLRDFTMNVNLSPKQLRRPDFGVRVQTALRRTGFDADKLCFEVTEDLILGDLPQGSALLSDLRARGVKLCMDDFGTGYSSLTYLHRFRFDYLKIEAAFVHAAEGHGSAEQIVRSMVNLARNLGVMPIAEGVESERQWTLLKQLGCPRAQGFFFVAPLPAEEFLTWVERHAAPP